MSWPPGGTVGAALEEAAGAPLDGAPALVAGLSDSDTVIFDFCGVFCGGDSPSESGAVAGRVACAVFGSVFGGDGFCSMITLTTATPTAPMPMPSTITHVSTLPFLSELSLPRRFEV